MSAEPSGSAQTDGIVCLRPWQDTDATALVECIDGDAEIARWLDQVPQPYTVADAHAYFAAEGEDKYAVTAAGSGRLLGSIGLRWNEALDTAELGYWVRADVRGTGVITRAVALAVQLAFASGAARVQLRAATDNAASRRVAEKAGFTLEGVLRSAHWNARLGLRQDWALYSLLPGERA